MSDQINILKIINKVETIKDDPFHYLEHYEGEDTYKLRIGDFFSFKRIGEDFSLGLKMLFKGKFKLRSPKVRRQKEIDRIFRATLSDK